MAIGCGTYPTESIDASAGDYASIRKDSVAPEPELELPSPNPYFNEIAQLLAAKIERDSLKFLRVDSSFYSVYKEQMRTELDGLEKIRFAPMRQLYAEHLFKEGVRPDLPVFYPFAGGDFIHVNHVFPLSKDYRLFALEPIGELPDFSQSESMDQVLADTREMLRDIFKRSYFITRNMNEDIYSKNRVSGLIYVLLWSLASTGHDIYSVEHVYLDTLGVARNSEVVGRAANFDKGVRVGFMADQDTAMSYLCYFDCDISNKGLAADQCMLAYLNALPMSNTFIKAASYLPHYGTFNLIRDIVLLKSTTIVQDDTGVPFRFVITGNFEVSLFGEYTPPVKDFSSSMLFQKDLNLAYQDSTYYKAPLPFSLGYHWNSNRQNQMLLVRK
jgi:hypothetical protein